MHFSLLVYRECRAFFCISFIPLYKPKESLGAKRERVGEQIESVREAVKQSSINTVSIPFATEEGGDALVTSLKAWINMILKKELMDRL